MYNDLMNKIGFFGNSISIPRGRKTTCRTLRDINPIDYNWKETYITYEGEFDSFEVYYSEDHPDYDIILKPSRVHLNKRFEDIFGFDFSCRDYDENRVVAIF